MLSDRYLDTATHYGFHGRHVAIGETASLPLRLRLMRCATEIFGGSKEVGRNACKNALPPIGLGTDSKPIWRDVRDSSGSLVRCATEGLLALNSI